MEIFSNKFYRKENTANPRLAACSAISRWTNLVSYGINGDMGTRPLKTKVNKHKNHKYTVVIFIYGQPL